MELSTALIILEFSAVSRKTSHSQRPDTCTQLQIIIFGSTLMFNQELKTLLTMPGGREAVRPGRDAVHEVVPLLRKD